jgi:predicted lipid-binding transport protein (Tim44 family)
MQRNLPMLKSLILALSVAVLSAGLAPETAEAKRIGGGGSSGMQRSTPSRAAPDAAPARPAQAAPTAPATPAATPPKRSWMGPLAGLAAGLGIAALMSHLGMGAEMGNILMLALLAFVAFVAIRFLMNRFARSSAATQSGLPAGMQYAGAGAPGALGGTTGSGWGQAAPAAGAVASVAPVPVLHALPAGFDTAGFERIAKMIFIRMQAANDSADLNDLRSFTTPEMFAVVKLDLQERGPTKQRTDVVKVDAEVLDVTTEAERQIVSVRFHGLIREEENGVAQPFDEAWHLVKPVDGSREWAIAGIQQTA